jgi:transcription elongation factor Elf1
MDRREFGKPKRILIAKVAAHCTHCGGETFVRTQRRQADKTDPLFCHACGAEHQYSALLHQIAAKVIARSDQLLRDAAAMRARVRSGPPRRSGPR